jgi:hypothetical protein
MLVALATASGLLAGTRTAAWWVIVPPFFMLFGYLLLLREAAKADAERRRYLDRTRMARPVRAPVKGPAKASAPRVAAEVIAIPADPAAPAPDPDGQEIYDQYTDAKLRAVGDLPRLPSACCAGADPEHLRAAE